MGLPAAAGAEAMLELAAAVGGAWPLGVSLAAAMAVQGLWAGRRRSSLNEALHELRRPLQALVLAAPNAGAGGRAQIESSLQIAANALTQLEREINGETIAPVRAPLFVRPLLEAAVERWQARASLAGASIGLRWMAQEAMLEGDRCELAQALDNLLVNAIEHGGPEIVVEARSRLGRLRIAVVDSGRESPATSPRASASSLIARLAGRSRHGHGLRVVRRAAAAHGGSFRLQRSAGRTEAAIELPLYGEVEQAG
jgi:signal transduction histidine kinase